VTDPVPLERLLEETLRSLGLPKPSLAGDLQANWDEVAGEPWAGKSRMRYIRQRELLVEAATPALVGLLRYAAGDLMRRLDGYLGEGEVESVRVVPPGRP
jgi:hypothetical protein